MNTKIAYVFHFDSIAFHCYPIIYYAGASRSARRKVLSRYSITHGLGVQRSPGILSNYSIVKPLADTVDY